MRTKDNRGVKGKGRNFPKQIPMEAKRFMIISMVAKGMTYTEILKECQEAWGLSDKTLQNVINETLQYMRSDEAKESLISMNMQRLDDIYAESRKKGDRKSAVKAVDVQNKMIGAYTENVKIEGDSIIDLHFDM